MKKLKNTMYFGKLYYAGIFPFLTNKKEIKPRSNFFKIDEIQLNTIDSYMRILHENRNTMKMYYLFLGVTYYLAMFQKCTIIFRSECSPEKILPITLSLRIMLLINTNITFLLKLNLLYI